MPTFNICITGKLTRPREEYEGRIKNTGHYWDEKVGRNTNLLVMADPNSGSAKARAATDRGVRCISEATLIAILADTDHKGFFNSAGNYVAGFTRVTKPNWDAQPAPGFIAPSVYPADRERKPVPAKPKFGTPTVRKIIQ